VDINELRQINTRNIIDDSINDIKKGVEKVYDFTDIKTAPDNKKGCLNRIVMQEYLIDSYHIVSYAGVPYVYKDGYYKRGNNVINSEICRISIENGIQANINKEIADITTFITSMTYEETFPFNKQPYAINVLNGVVLFDTKTGTYELVKHSPDYRFNYVLNIVYNPDAPDTIYKECFCKWTDEPDVLLQIPAQALIQSFNDSPFKKAYLIQADPHAGKSTYLNMLYKMFDGFISSVPLQDFTKQFSIPALENMMFNISDDLSDIPMAETGTFKNLTGSYYQWIRTLHKEGRQGRCNAVHVYTCNVPPQTDKRCMLDSAFWERWQYILFNNYFPIDSKFTDGMYTTENLSGIFNRILEMISLIIIDNKLPFKQDMEAVRERWSLATDVIYQFIDENIDTGYNNVLYVDKDDFLDTIKRWAIANDKDMRKIPISTKALTSTLSKHNIESVEKRYEGGKSYTYMINGRWRDNTRFQAKTYKTETKQIKVGYN